MEGALPGTRIDIRNGEVRWPASALLAALYFKFIYCFQNYFCISRCISDRSIEAQYPPSYLSSKLASRPPSVT